MHNLILLIHGDIEYGELTIGVYQPRSCIYHTHMCCLHAFSYGSSRLGCFWQHGRIPHTSRVSCSNVLLNSVRQADFLYQHWRGTPHNCRDEGLFHAWHYEAFFQIYERKNYPCGKVKQISGSLLYNLSTWPVVIVPFSWNSAAYALPLTKNIPPVLEQRQDVSMIQ